MKIIDLIEKEMINIAWVMSDEKCTDIKHTIEFTGSGERYKIHVHKLKSKQHNGDAYDRYNR